MSSQNVAPGRPGMEHEQPELAPQLAVVALLRFLDLREVGLQILVGEKRGAVDALHRLVARVAFPVGARRAQQLERLQLAGRRHVRPDAEVDEGVLVLDGVAGHLGLAFGLLVDQLHLQRLAALREKCLRVLTRPHLALIDEILLRQLLHLLLDRVEVLRDERTIDHEVVEKAFVGGGTDPALRVRKEIDHRRREQMRRAVAVERQRFGAPVGHDAHRGVLPDGRGQVDQFAVDHASQRRLGEAGRDLGRQVAYRGARRHSATRSIRKRDSDLTHFGDCGEAFINHPALAGHDLLIGRHGWTRTTDLLRVKQAL